jgi:5-methylcytosine-specific restriction endonuclease McrA
MPRWWPIALVLAAVLAAVGVTAALYLNHLDDRMSWTRHPSRRKATLPPDWPARRRAVLVRDKYQCQIRGPRCIGTANQVDHAGDSHDHENLRAACEPCHADRSAQQGGSASTTARRARIAARKRPAERHPGLCD